MDAYVGEIRTFAGNFAPRGWQICNGGLYPISQYTAMFSILGITYGGDGKVTFGIPNLEGITLIHQGQGVGLTNWNLGETNGTETNTILTSNLPNHNHLVNAFSGAGDSEDPTGNVFGGRGKNDFDLTNTTPNGVMNPLTITPTGKSISYDNMQPYITLNYIICFDGIFPMKP